MAADDRDAERLPPGVLAPPPADRWRLSRREPAADQANFIAWLWAVEWDLRGVEDHVQSTLPHPSAHLVVEDRTVNVYGPTRRRFTRTLSGAGRVVGIRFRPSGIRLFTDVPTATLIDQCRPASEVVPSCRLDPAALANEVDAIDDLDKAMTLLAVAVGQPRSNPDSAAGRAAQGVDEIVDLIEADRSIRTVDDLATATGRHRRSIQRLLAEHVGLGPKAIIRRYRLQEAAAAALDGCGTDWADLAVQLGYYDQAHLVRDFTDVIGKPPAQYARTNERSTTKRHRW